MVNIPMKTGGAWNKDTLLSVNALKPGQVRNAQNIEGLNRKPGTPPSPPSAQMRTPALAHPIRKGQKVPLSSGASVRQADVCLGWNSTDARCDVDVSAFLLGENGKVIGDDWFVFYGQTKSPDGSVAFEVDGVTDREVIHVDLAKLNPSVRKIVFVLTIHEALEKGLHFGMLKDAYIRILGRGNQIGRASCRERG